MVEGVLRGQIKWLHLEIVARIEKKTSQILGPRISFSTWNTI